MRALGVERLDFRPTTERRRLTPGSTAVKGAMLEAEKKRLEAWEEARRLAAQEASVPVLAATA